MKTLRELCSGAKPKNEPKDNENVENKTIKRKSTASNISNKKIKILSPIENNLAHYSATNTYEKGQYYQQQLQPPLSQPNQQQLMQPPLSEQQQQLLQSQRLFQQQQFIHYQPNQHVLKFCQKIIKKSSIQFRHFFIPNFRVTS